jgi:uncharacterized coiled-coil DUF342 family protein
MKTKLTTELEAKLRARSEPGAINSTIRDSDLTALLSEIDELRAANKIESDNAHAIHVDARREISDLESQIKSLEQELAEARWQAR